MESIQIQKGQYPVFSLLQRERCENARIWFLGHNQKLPFAKRFLTFMIDATLSCRLFSCNCRTHPQSHFWLKTAAATAAAHALFSERQMARWLTVRRKNAASSYILRSGGWKKKKTWKKNTRQDGFEKKWSKFTRPTLSQFLSLVWRDFGVSLKGRISLSLPKLPCWL